MELSAGVSAELIGRINRAGIRRTVYFVSIPLALKNAHALLERRLPHRSVANGKDTLPISYETNGWDC